MSTIRALSTVPRLSTIRALSPGGTRWVSTILGLSTVPRPCPLTHGRAETRAFKAASAHVRLPLSLTVRVRRTKGNTRPAICEMTVRTRCSRLQVTRIAAQHRGTRTPRRTGWGRPGPRRTDWRPPGARTGVDPRASSPTLCPVPTCLLLSVCPVPTYRQRYVPCRPTLFSRFVLLSVGHRLPFPQGNLVHPPKGSYALASEGKLARPSARGQPRPCS